MQEIWYGDKPDIVKWAAVKEITDRASTKNVLQVLFYRPCLLCVESAIGNQQVVGNRIPFQVYRHVGKNLARAIDLGHDLGLDVALIEDAFEIAHRKEYIQAVVDRIKSFRRLVVLLDPDTGVEPEQPKGSHVTREEIGDIWSSLKPKMWLLLYQHRPRGAKQNRWILDRRKRFAKRLVNPPPGDVLTLKSPDIEKNVVLFAARKP